jgi:2-polyprenyl-3-methyl-5-hydroxy-6-metoxy-1,4-benzoquinol methylase
MESVRAQYERFPYPPVPALALPRRGQAGPLSWERGAELAGRERAGHEGLRILVARCGTLEPLVVAQAHPRAAEIVAVDISESSISRLRTRTALARISNAVLGFGFRPRIPPMVTMRADLTTWEGGTFDYILATDVLHHTGDPAALLGRLAGWLRPGGLMRVVTYSSHGRMLMRAIGRWLLLGGLTPQTPSLVGRARARMAELPSGHPLRLSFDANPESRTATGLVDAYLHACENPLSPEGWGQAASAAGLTLVGEDHAPTSQSAFVDALWPELAGLSAWRKLGLLDDLLEVIANPVLWLERGESPAEAASRRALEAQTDPSAEHPPGAGTTLGRDGPIPELALGDVLWLPSQLRWEIGQGLRRAARRSEAFGVDAAKLVSVLASEVGPRIDASGQDLAGLTVHELGGERLMALPRP